jgi:phosphoglycerate dehydrogenase-like enzyme
MKKMLVATQQGTVDSLMRTEDRERLESLVDVTWRTSLDRDLNEEEYSKVVKESGAEIILCGWGSPLFTKRVWDDNPQVAYVVNLTGELKRYVHRDCIAGNLLVTNWGDVPAASVAEGTLMMTLASLRKARYWQLQMHQTANGWQASEGRWVPEGLFDKTVGLYGYGRIAREFVEMLKPFNVRLLVLSSWISDEDKAAHGLEAVVDLKELFSRSDIVSIHTGIRPDTEHSVNSDVLAAMRDGGHIINTARGKIIDEAALLVELKSGRLFAALDVYEVEPLPADHPFRGLPNCLLFPHQGGPTMDYRWRCGANAVDQVARYLQGEELKHRITLKQYDRMT